MCVCVFIKILGVILCVCVCACVCVCVESRLWPLTTDLTWTCWFLTRSVGQSSQGVTGF